MTDSNLSLSNNYSSLSNSNKEEKNKKKANNNSEQQQQHSIFSYLFGNYHHSNSSQTNTSSVGEGLGFSNNNSEKAVNNLTGLGSNQQILSVGTGNLEYTENNSLETTTNSNSFKDRHRLRFSFRRKKSKSNKSLDLPVKRYSYCSDSEVNIEEKNNTIHSTKRRGSDTPNSKHLTNQNSRNNLKDMFTDTSSGKKTLSNKQSTESIRSIKRNGLLVQDPAKRGSTWLMKNISDKTDSNYTDDTLPESDDGHDKLYCIRVFRPDSTFATISCPFNTTVPQLCQLLGRKFFIEDISKFTIYLQRRNLERALNSYERPISIMKKLLESIGYTSQDKLQNLGREDNTYYFRFIFDLAQIYTVQPQPDIPDRHQVDLSMQNLRRLPFNLTSRAHEVYKLILSNNLMLDFSSDYFHTFRNLEEIHLSECELQSVPPCIKALNNLVHLNLSSNRIKEISSAGLESLSYLTYINLANNRIESIPADFKHLTNLTHLNISNNRFALFPETICLIDGLTELDISFNQIKQIPSSIQNLKKLQTLILISNELQGSLPTNMRELVELKELDLRKNMISDSKSLSSLPKLEKLFCDYNSISIFEPSFHSLAQLTISKNSITQLLSPRVPVQTLTDLNISSCKLVTLPDDFFAQLPSLLKLVLDNNLLVSLPDSIQSLTSLEFLSCSICDLTSLPNDISNLQSLVSLDLHGNNLKLIPTSIWTLKKLTNLNVSSNLLETFPNPQTQSKKISFNSQHTKSDSQKSEDYQIPPLAQCLQSLFLADNRLDDMVFEPLSYLTELRALNLSYNDLTEISQGSLSHMSSLIELYLSGNQFTSLPSEEFVYLRNLKILYLNGNKLQNLPSDLSKNNKLNTLDLGSNFLKYNITNWLYDWNWNWNFELIYLNLSGNRRFKIKSNHQDNFNAKSKNLSDFSTLKKLAVLGLMGVTCEISLPKETPDKRIRTGTLEINQMGYGLADSLAKKASSNHLWTWDLAIEKFAKRDDSALFAIFDAHINPLYGSRITKFLNDYFPHNFLSELGKLDSIERDIEVAIRRTFINLNKELGSTGIEEYSQMGSSAIVAYVEGNTLYVANAGDAVAVICRNGGMAHLISTRHTPWSTSEIQRIRNSKGLISSQGLLNGISEISRGFGHFKLLPLINANPFIQKIELSDHDEFVILASRSLWDLMTYQTAVDIARTERDDLLYAAQKVRDFAIAYGADEGIVVMIIGVGDLFDQPIRVTKTGSNFNNINNINNNQWPDGIGIRISEHRSEEAAFSHNWKRSRRPKQAIHGDTVMNRLNPEVEAPTGQVALVFTDIKNSTFLWETVDTAMRTANRIHNLVMRRILRTYGGFEVKSEGDAFMLSFPTVSSALLCCLSVQLHLLQEDWPQQILDTEEGKEIFDKGFSNDLLYRGLSVRMGIHWGSPVCEVDPTTLRMDYFGPMVNRAARICGAADGGQICVSSDVVSEIKVLESMLTNDEPSTKLPRDVRLLKKIGFSIVEMGERKLKGLEKAETLSLVFPNSLKRRLQYSTINFLESQQTMFAAPQPQTLDPSAMRKLGYQCLRLERLACDNVVVSNPVSQMDLLNNFLSFQIKDDATDADLVNLLDSLIVRVENVVSTLYLSQIHKLVSLSELAETPNEIEAISSALAEISKIVTDYQTHKNLISGEGGQTNTGLF